MPKISVIVPVYNVEKYLSRSLDCLINQTLSDIDIILINDCSTDGSLGVMQEYASKDERIKIIDLKENSGAAVARNKGLEIATGEYLGFIDPDDSIDLNYYEELYKAAIEGDYDIVKCQRKTFFEDKKFEISTLNKTIEQKGKYYFTYEWTTAIYRHSIIKEHHIKFPEECRKAQDVVFLSRIIFKAKSLKLINNVFYYYWKRNDSLNAKKIPLTNIESANFARKLILQEVNNSNLYDINPDLYIKVYSTQFSSIFFTLSQNDTFQAKKLCAQCIIDNTYFCKDVEKFITNFSYPWMIEYIKTKDCNTLAKYLKRIKNNSYIQKPLLWYQKIFSCQNDVRGKYKKIIYILGIKLSIKKNPLLTRIEELECKNNELKDSIRELKKNTNTLYKLKTEGINKEKIASELENLKDYYGVINSKREPKVIISLTSYPDRMYDIHYCLYSLLKQTIKPDKIILWLAEEQFPNKEIDVPQKVLDLVEFGLTIRFTKDIKSYKKLIPALIEFKNDIIVTADDDIYYPSNWLELLYNEHLNSPTDIICHRAHKITFSDNNIDSYAKWERCVNSATNKQALFPTTGGGMLFPPNSLSPEVFREDIFTQLTPYADDIWFWAMSKLNNTNIKLIKNPINEITLINPERDILHKENLYFINATQNDVQLNNILNHYPEILEKLLKEDKE